MAQSQQTEMQLFSGGLNTRNSSYLMQPNEARNLSNVELRSHSLDSKNGHVLDAPETDSMFFYHRDIYFYYDAFRNNVSWNGNYYWSDAFEVKKWVEGIGELNVGVAPPLEALTISAATADGEGLTGKYTYIYTYYDRDTGVESPPSPPSNELLVSGEAINITGLAPAPLFGAAIAQDFQFRIYRVGEGITVFTSVITLASTETTYTDELRFTQVEGYLLETLRSFPPEPTMVNLCESRGRFYGSVGSNLRFSALGKPDSWYVLDSLAFPDEITMLVAVANGLLVATQYKTWVVTGDTPSRFQRYLISDSEGCISNQSIAVYGGYAVWLTNDGISMSNGGAIQDLTLPKLNRIAGIDPISATVVDNTYYLAYTESSYPSDNLFPSDTLYPAFQQANPKFASGMYIIDFSFGQPVIEFANQPNVGFVGHAGLYLDQITNDLTSLRNITTEDEEFNLITEDETFNIIGEIPIASNSRYHMFEGDHSLELEYLSPLFTEQSMGVEKQYEKARITFKGEFAVRLLDHNGEEFASTTIQSDDLASTWIGISPKKNRGYGIQYEIIGTGLVASISHVWTPREAQ